MIFISTDIADSRLNPLGANLVKSDNSVIQTAVTQMTIVTIMTIVTMEKELTVVIEVTVVTFVAQNIALLCCQHLLQPFMRHPILFQKYILPSELSL